MSLAVLMPVVVALVVVTVPDAVTTGARVIDVVVSVAVAACNDHDFLDVTCGSRLGEQSGTSLGEHLPKAEAAPFLGPQRTSP